MNYIVLDLEWNQGNAAKEPENPELSFEIIATIASMIEAKDSYTKGHSIRVAEYSAILATALGWKEETVTNLRYIALLHDIGKVGIPDRVLNKPGKLTYSFFKTKQKSGMRQSIPDLFVCI